MLLGLIPLLLLGCKPDATAPASPGPDLTELLGAGQARAGVVSDPEALFGGIAAEGAPGDIKIYNDRAQFIIQGVHQGSYYIQQGGGVIDADIVRPAGQLGRDRIDEWGGMYGLGRMMSPSSVAVVDDGVDSGRAHVRVQGSEAPMALLEGSIESPGFVQDFGLDIVTDFFLPADSWLMEVRTTVTASAGEVTVPIGDIIMGGPEASDSFNPGTGIEAYDGSPREFSGYRGRHNDGAVGIVAAPGAQLEAGGMDLLAGLADLTVAFSPLTTIPAGGSVSVTRYYAVGPDFATISDASLVLRDTPTDTVEGVVRAEDGPVEGAAVFILIDGAPYTVAVSDADGAFSAQVPKGSNASPLAVGRVDGLHLDLPEGASPTGPYSGAPQMAAGLAALSEGALPVRWADGRGVADASDPLRLGVPAQLSVQADDGLPFEVQLRITGADPAVDSRMVHGRTHGLAAAAWSRDGDVSFPVEPGSYDLLVHRGIRYEVYESAITLAAGEARTVQVSLPQAYKHPGWIWSDPHSHAAPSGDGELPMEDRLLVHAGVGIQLHFGTDHDHIAAYQPLIDAMGMQQVLHSVLSDEVSPVLRGHTNIYPLEVLPDKPNHGAWPWWSEPVENTDQQYALLRERHGDILIQANHPTGSGLAAAAGWSEGQISSPDRWSDDFDCVEVINSGQIDDYVAFWRDAVNRGIPATPVGVSDSHSHFGGLVGANGTFIQLGINKVSDYTDDKLREALRGGRTIASLGVFLDLSIDPGTTLTAPASLEVTAKTPSWITVDRLLLVENGEVIETVDGERAIFELNPTIDAHYEVIAEGDDDMAPVWPGRKPWAMSAPILVDLAGDGWDPPLPPFELR